MSILNNNGVIIEDVARKLPGKDLWERYLKLQETLRLVGDKVWTDSKTVYN